MTEPKVSVVVPTYNRHTYLRQAVESVLAQSYGAFEIVISDNCSSDATDSVVGSFRDPRIRYFRNERNIGMVPNWNVAIRRARGGYVAFLEDDNWWHPRYLERTVQALDAHPQAAFANTAAWVTDRYGKPFRIHKRWDEDRLCHGPSELRDLMQGNKIVLSSVTLRRDRLHSVGLFDETVSYAADWEMWLRLCTRYPALYLAEPLAFNRVHEGSSTAQFLPQTLMLFHDHCQVIEKTLHSVRAAYGHRLARDLRRLSYRWLAGFQAGRAWDAHKAGEPVLARREAALAVKCAPTVVFRFPLEFSSILLTSFLPHRIGRFFLVFEQRAGRPLIRYVRSAFRGLL